LCVTNTWYGTKLIVNVDIPEIKEFKVRSYLYHTFLVGFVYLIFTYTTLL